MYKGRVPGVLVYFLVVALGAFGGTLITAIVVPDSWPAPYAWLIRASTVMALVIGITRFFLARTHWRWADVGFGGTRWLAALIEGTAGGSLLAACWLAVIYWISPFELAWNHDVVATRFVAATIGTIAMGIAEEVGYRSYGLVQARRIAGYGSAVTLSSAIFVAAHIAGGVPWQAALLVVGSASVLFCVLMLETRSLPLVIALHATTNLVQDNTLRGTANASLFTARAAASTPHDELAVWTAMASINLIVAAGIVAWSRRRSAG